MDRDFPAGYTSREEWLEDRRQAYLDRLTRRQRISRWWSWYWPAVVVLVILVGIAVVALYAAL